MRGKGGLEWKGVLAGARSVGLGQGYVFCVRRACALRSVFEALELFSRMCSAAKEKVLTL